ncbi:MAG: hypothetical protein IPK88_03965 [Saprospiraceae bacterium]|nr:hypothetical protein [Candidatus Defluviibacterium haderslevense]
MKKLTLSVILISILLSSCDFDLGSDPVDQNKIPELPPLTTEGKNTLGCLVNGKVWVAKVPINLSGDVAFQMGYDSITGHFGINSLWESQDYSIHQRLGFESYINNLIVGNYKLYRNPAFPDFIDKIWKSYWVKSNLLNQINIHYINKEKKIISGTFEFTVIDTINADTIKITDGRFDGRY